MFTVAPVNEGDPNTRFAIRVNGDAGYLAVGGPVNGQLLFLHQAEAQTIADALNAATLG